MNWRLTPLTNWVLPAHPPPPPVVLLPGPLRFTFPARAITAWRGGGRGLCI